MKIRSLCFGALAAGSFTVAAQAAEVDAKGASELVKSLTDFLPEKAASSGFLEAVPQGDHYRLSADFGRLVRAFLPAGELDVSGLYDLLVFPPAGPEGLMAVRRDSSDLALSARWNKEGMKGNLAYLLKDVTFDGQFDPSIPYFRDAVSHASGGTMTSDDGKQQLEASFGPIDQKLSSVRNPDGSVDIGGTAEISGFRETIRGQDMPTVTFNMGTMSVDAAVKGLRLQELKSVFEFLSVRASQESLSTDEKKTLAELARKILPVMTGIEEKITVEKLAVEASGFGLTFDKAGYVFGMGGLGDRSEVHFGFSLDKPKVTGVPEMMLYGDLLPEAVNIAVSIPELNFKSAVDTFFAEADFDKPEPLTEAQSEALGRAFLPDGRLKVAFPDISARSGVYDVAITGSMSVDIQSKPEKASADFDVTAKDIDRTIKSIQELAQKVPQLNTTSFVLMMAKGMAKTDADGTSRWKVEVSEDQVVKVNGQVMPH
jgi:hypothetical protein